MKRLLIALFCLIAGVSHGAQFTLSWTDNSTNETGFRIERSSNGTAFIEINTAGATGSEMQVLLTNGSTTLIATDFLL